MLNFQFIFPMTGDFWYSNSTVDQLDLCLFLPFNSQSGCTIVHCFVIHVQNNIYLSIYSTNKSMKDH